MYTTVACPHCLGKGIKGYVNNWHHDLIPDYCDNCSGTGEINQCCKCHGHGFVTVSGTVFLGMCPDCEGFGQI